MAKVIAPLFSGSASGKVGTMMVFQKNGIARAYVVPSNPQTVAQMAQRNQLKDIQAELKLLGSTLRTELRAGFGARWNADIIGELTANGGAALDGYVTEFNAFQAGEKTDWADDDTAVPVVIADGALLYAVSSAVYDMAARLGVSVTLTQPAAANSATIAAEWVAAA